MKTFRPYSPRQGFLLPPSPMEWLPEDHLAYFILDVVSQLDLSKILEPYEREERGFPPHDPKAARRTGIGPARPCRAGRRLIRDSCPELAP